MARGGPASPLRRSSRAVLRLACPIGQYSTAASALDTDSFMMLQRADWRARGITAWALVGVFALMTDAVVRLGARGLQTVSGDLDPIEWVGLIAATAAFSYLEGYRVFQRRAAPEIIARAFAVSQTHRPAFAYLAPLYALSLVDEDRRRVLRGWALVAIIIFSILLVRSLPDPWRGIVDASVATALTWGNLALLRELARRAI
jgi:hypothetical protein